jgi:hypothetical protein
MRPPRFTIMGFTGFGKPLDVGATGKWSDAEAVLLGCLPGYRLRRVYGENKLGLVEFSITRWVVGKGGSIRRYRLESAR